MIKVLQTLMIKVGHLPRQWDQLSQIVGLIAQTLGQLQLQGLPRVSEVRMLKSISYEDYNNIYCYGILQ